MDAVSKNVLTMQNRTWKPTKACEVLATKMPPTKQKIYPQPIKTPLSAMLLTSNTEFAEGHQNKQGSSFQFYC